MALEKELNQCLLIDSEMNEHSVSHIPIGAYPDPLQPLVNDCGNSTNLFMIVRKGQDQHIRIFPGFPLILSSLALHVQDEYADKIKAVKVWFDPTDSVPKGMIVATLRPKSFEQHALSLPILSGNEDGENIVRRIRVEVVTKNKVEVPMESCEVHAICEVGPLPFTPDEEDGEGEEDEDCSTGLCPR